MGLREGEGRRGVVCEQTNAGRCELPGNHPTDRQSRTITSKMWLTLRDGPRLDIKSIVHPTGRRTERSHDRRNAGSPYRAVPRTDRPAAVRLGQPRIDLPGVSRKEVG